MKTCAHPACSNKVNRTRNKYCSRICARRANKENLIDEIQTCIRKECSNTFTDYRGTQKFCSRSCSAQYHNAPRKLSKECPMCGKSMRTGQIFCSVECRQDSEILKWVSGELNGCWKYTHASYVRRYLDRRSNSSCEECGFNKVARDGRSILQVDHIDGNWRNNVVDNVRLLCPNCHALTDNWGARNMGNGRKWKNKYSQF